MNQIYRLVFNRARGIIQVTSELGNMQGKRPGGRRKVDAGEPRTLKTAAGRVAVALALSMATPLLCAVLAASLSAPVWAAGGRGGADGGGQPGGAGGTAASPDGSTASGGNGGGGGGSVSLTTGAGGAGGAGGDDVSGTGGTGGSGGAPAMTAVMPTANTVSLTGEAGADGGSGVSNGFSGGGGGGGGGGFGWVVKGMGDSSNAAAIIGGAGGNGGSPSSDQFGGGGGGGQGGGGVVLTGGGDLTALSGSDIVGGDGGNGGDGDTVISEAGGGGDGGAGIVLTAGGSVTNANRAGIAGGTGGNGGATADIDGGPGGDGGAGVSGSGFAIVNHGQISGGKGGSGGISTGKAKGDPGAGGVGIIGDGLSIINSGTISGGLNGDGTTRANAIEVTGGGNRLTLEKGSSITGNVVSTSGGTNGGDTLALGGDSTADGGIGAGTFDIGQIGNTRQYRGFTHFDKTGSSTWTLTNKTDASADQNWTISAGTLVGNTDSLQGDITDNAHLTFNQAEGVETFAGVISGSGTLIKTGDGQLNLTGANTYTGGTTISAGSLLGNTDSLQGDITNNAALGFGQATDGTYAGTIDGTGVLVKIAPGTLTLTGANSYSGGTFIGSPTGYGGEDAGTLRLGDGGTSGSIDGDVTNNGALVFERSDAVTFDGAISGSGRVSQSGTGTTTLTGTNTYTGGTSVDAGTLAVDGSTAGDATVASGATLTGSGAIGGTVTVADGGTLSGEAGRTLGLGSLTLSSGSNVDASLGAPSDTGLFDVTDDVTLDGTLNVADAGSFGVGLYRIVDYGGTLTDNGLDIGATPTGTAASDLTVQTAIDDQINLVYSKDDNGGESGGDNNPPVVRNFWDGGDAAQHDNDRVDGGSGTWQRDDNNWTGMTGATNGAYPSTASVVIFAATGDTVTVDDGAESIAVHGLQFAADGYRITGDTLTLEDARTAIRVGDGTAAGRLITATIASRLTGQGGLDKTDLGTLILTGANTYTGGTTVAAGTLVGDADSIRGDLANAGTVVFDQAQDATYAGDIAGHDGTAGTVTKQGAGELTLSGDSSLDWTLEKGSLVSATDRFSGDLNIADGATMIFDQATSGTYGGNLSGSGELQFTGGGVVALTGDNASFTSTSTVRNSTLVVNQSLGGAVAVADGGRLQGNGTVGATTVASGGTVAPGNSIGTLSINGDVTFAEGARYEVEVDPAGTDSDRINATGTATLNGGSVVHVGNNGTYDLTSTYTILTADNGVDGTFDSVSSDFAFLDPTLGYGANDVTLTLQRNRIAFVDAARTRNQRATAAAVDSLTAGNAVYDSVVQLDETSARQSFDALAGESHASTRTALIQDSRYVREAMLDRLRRSSDAGEQTPVAAGTQTTGGNGDSAAWMRAIGAFGDTDGDGNAADLDRHTQGFLLGGDARLAGAWRAGVTAGFTRTDFDVDARNASGDSDNYHVGVYGGTRQGPVALRLGAAYSWHDIDTTRTVAFTGFRNGLQAQHDANTAQVFGEVGYDIDLGAVTLEPFAGGTYVNVDSDGFTETGGPAALHVQGEDTDTTFSTVGLRVSRTLDLGGMHAALHGSAGWRHAYGDTTPTATNALAGSPDFTVAGASIAEDSAVVDAGVGVDIGGNATLGVSYSGLYGSDVQDHGGRLDLRVRF